MEELELKHILPYVPFGVKTIDLCTKEIINEKRN